MSDAIGVLIPLMLTTFLVVAGWYFVQLARIYRWARKAVRKWR